MYQLIIVDIIVFVLSCILWRNYHFNNMSKKKYCIVCKRKPIRSIKIDNTNNYVSKYIELILYNNKFENFSLYNKDQFKHFSFCYINL